MRNQLVAMCLCAAAGCQDRGDTVAVETNDLGVVRVEIHHDAQSGERLLTVRGLDGNDQEIAVATLRTGMVLYTPEPELLAPAWSAGTELTVSVRDESFTSVTPDREPHEVVAPATQAAFARLHVVAAAISDEAGIRFAAPTPALETAFAAATCTASRFPTNVGNPAQCCEDGAATWHKIPSGTSVNKLGYRTYSTSCRTSSGGAVCGNPGSPQGACTYGPCGGKNEVVAGTNTTSAAVFHPTSQPTQCGADANGNAAGGTQVPPASTELYSSQTLYTGVTATCPYVSCCYQPNAGTSVAETTATCLSIDGEACTTNPTCMSGHCNGLVGEKTCDECVPINCPTPHLCGDTDNCGNLCKGPCIT